MKINDKIFNDPVYGFVRIPSGIILDLINHPWFQRLRRIRQLGLTHLVYPGAQHSRFHHVIGAMSLTMEAVLVLRSKGVQISEDEEEAVALAVLLHDIGHGPFSHTLEYELISDVSHEAISLMIMRKLNDLFTHKLDLAIDIYTGAYTRKFLHQLVSSQLDMDRLDYLRRDSFYTGVQEGIVGNDRIIHMLNVHNDQLVVDEKGIYSVEKFLVARRLMYWQVYLHKTVVAAETLLVNILRCAKATIKTDENLFASPVLKNFLQECPNEKDLINNSKWIELYAQLDDDDIMAAIKVWANASHPVLSKLCRMLINRELPKIKIQNESIPESLVAQLQENLEKEWQLNPGDGSYFIYADSIKNKAYNMENLHIQILFKNGEVKDIARASDLDNIGKMSETVTKYFLCFPKKQ